MAIRWTKVGKLMLLLVFALCLCARRLRLPWQGSLWRQPRQL